MIEKESYLDCERKLKWKQGGSEKMYNLMGNTFIITTPPSISLVTSYLISLLPIYFGTNEANYIMGKEYYHEYGFYQNIYQSEKEGQAIAFTTTGLPSIVSPGKKK